MVNTGQTSACWCRRFLWLLKWAGRSDMNAPNTPRRASTVLLLRDDPFEVLMVKRHSKATYADALVFPGGVVDEADWSDDWLPYLSGAEDLPAEQRALRIAAARECFEEAGILPAVDVPPTDPSLSSQPLLQTMPFLETVAQCGSPLDLKAFVHFAHWLTPDFAPKRFDTHFWLAHAPEGQIACNDGNETVSLEWVQPKEAIASAIAGMRTIVFVTLMNLKRLAESESVAAAMKAARGRPYYLVQPQRVSLPDGDYITIPPEAGYPEGRQLLATTGVKS